MAAMAPPDRPLLTEHDIDTLERRSLSFGPSTATRTERASREPVPVGPGRSAPSPSVSFPISGEVVHEFPLQLAKVQRPTLRRETLRRERLLAWLKVQVHHRVVLVTAEAGYGKTTLLADFARHHRRPTMWYRLDEDDRNWISFLHYLIAAGRELEPEFAPATKGLLAELGVASGPSRDTIIGTFIRELQSLGPRGAALIIDDYHLVDDVPDIRFLVKELISRAPERLSVDQQRLVSAMLALRRGDVPGARASLDAIAIGRPHTVAAFMSRVLLTKARLAVAEQSEEADKVIASALHLAVRQGAKVYVGSARVMQGAIEGQQAFNEAVRYVAAEGPASLSLIAELLASRLALLDPPILATVASDAARVPDRWREALRPALERDDRPLRLEAAIILDRIGERQDIRPLRRIAKELRTSPGAPGLGLGLARRLAAQVFVEDQGRLSIRVGDATLDAKVRGNVWALVCFLLSRPNMSAARDQVLDALWPEQSPKAAVNSLNQTIYFLRRYLEPSFSEETSPGYIHHDSEMVWLDPELVDSRSARSRAAMRLAERDPSPENVELVSQTYHGRFALDFDYEEWAGQYRDSMHATYLEIIERAVSGDTNAGAFDRAIGLARRALEVAPEAEQIELTLLKLYLRTSANSAAAELYAHYAAVYRKDGGDEPPSLESL